MHIAIHRYRCESLHQKNIFPIRRSSGETYGLHLRSDQQIGWWGVIPRSLHLPQLHHTTYSLSYCGLRPPPQTLWWHLPKPWWRTNADANYKWKKTLDNFYLLSIKSFDRSSEPSVLNKCRNPRFEYILHVFLIQESGDVGSSWTRKLAKFRGSSNRSRDFFRATKLPVDWHVKKTWNQACLEHIPF